MFFFEGRALFSLAITNALRFGGSRGPGSGSRKLEFLLLFSIAGRVVLELFVEFVELLEIELDLP